LSRTLYPVVLVGGRGARLWPVSRESLPKVFQSLASDQSLLQETVARLERIDNLGSLIVVCNAEHTRLVRRQLDVAADVELLVEPVRRNTAPAVAAAGEWLRRRDPDAVMLVLPADHVITDIEAFQSAVVKAAAAASGGRFVTFGIEPTHPETEYGYIRMGDALVGHAGAHEIDQFVEKPDATMATAMLSEGGHVWNSGMFVFPVRDLADELQACAPDVQRAAKDAVRSATADNGIVHLDETAFANAPSISIDYALMEKTSRAAVVPCDLGWSDVGNWNALWERGTKDDDENVLVGDVVATGTQNSLLRSDGPLVVGVGLQDTIVVATEDAILVGARSKIRDVGTVVDHLAAQRRVEAQSHKSAARDWGVEEVMDSGAQFRVRRLAVHAGQTVPVRTLEDSKVNLCVVTGTARIARDGAIFTLTQGSAIHIESGQPHQIENPGDTPLTIIETICGPDA